MDEERVKTLLQIDREIKILKARESLRDLIEYVMYDPEDPENPHKSQFDCQPHHTIIINMFENVEKGIDKRAALSVQPQAGKTTCTSLFGIAWALARRPQMNIILGTYSEVRAEQVGEKVRQIITSERFKDVFPEFQLRPGSKGKSYLGTMLGGGALFAGRGSAVTGNPCDLFLIDDPIKDHMEANSPTIRAQAWEWYCAVVFSRCHTGTCIFIIHTRWTEDDLIGRQCDPNHSEHDPQVSDKWTYINLPAIVDDPELAKILGIELGKPLWEKRFSLELLEEAKKQNPETFSALYMGKPVPDEGSFFKKDMIVEYPREYLPTNLRMYATSDHALKAKQRSDSTVLLIWGVDQKGVIWIVDCVWGKFDPQEAVEKMCFLMEKYQPLTWWSGRDHIVGTLGPFLRKRMQERKIFKTWVQEAPDRGDKQQKAQSIRGRMGMGMVRFPKEAGWMAKAKMEILKFDKAGHDDFVDALALIGRQLDTLFSASGLDTSPPPDIPKTGSYAWVRWAADKEKFAKKIKEGLSGW